MAPSLPRSFQNVFVTLKRKERIDHRRIEPGAAPGGGHLERRGRAVGRVKDFNGLREAEDAGEERNLLALFRVRLTLTVPVLVERADRLDGRVRKRKRLGDIGAAFAPRADDFARALRAARHDGQQPPRALQEELAGRRVSRDEPERFERPGPVDVREVGFEVVVVGAEERREAGGVAGAAQILHQQRVEQGRALVGVKLQHLGDAHADQATAHGVPGALSFRQVQRIRQPGEHF